MIASIALTELRKDARDCGFNWWRRQDSTTGFWDTLAPALAEGAADANFIPRGALQLIKWD